MEWRLDAEADGSGMRSEWEVRMSLQQVWTIFSRSLAVSPKGMLQNFHDLAVWIVQIWKQLQCPSVIEQYTSKNILSHCMLSERKQAQKIA